MRYTSVPETYEVQVGQFVTALIDPSGSETDIGMVSHRVEASVLDLPQGWFFDLSVSH